jgi:tripartite-type tricarboxylate transporter receptor subunit TctC
MPEAILTRLSAELATMLQGENYRARLAKSTLDNAMSTPQEMARLWLRWAQKWPLAAVPTNS